jgi:hypothetical protein
VADAQRVGRRAPIATVGRWLVKRRQLESPVPVWGLQHGDLRPDALQPDDAIHPVARHRRLSLELESELDEKRHRVREVVDDDAHVLEPPDRHVPDDRRASESVAWSFGGRGAVAGGGDS